MVKNRLSGQTIAIIILSVLLLLTACFGGVYAYYSTNTSKVSGRIVMANLNINLQAGIGESASSEILVSNGVFVPGQPLENTPLVVVNESNTPIYLSIIYKVNASNIETGEPLENYDDTNPLIDIGIDDDSLWYDYLFVTTGEDGQEDRYRCLITKTPQYPTETNEYITVIEENALSIPRTWGDEFQNMQISFLFQAYAIGSNTFTFSSEDTIDFRCQEIMTAIYEAYEGKINI